MEKNQLIIIVLVVGAFLLFGQMKQTGYQVYFVAQERGTGSLPLHAIQSGDAGNPRKFVSSPSGWNDNINDFTPEYLRRKYDAPTYTTPYEATPKSCMYDSECFPNNYCDTANTCQTKY